jgi:hypothetical protein
MLKIMAGEQFPINIPKIIAEEQFTDQNTKDNC